MSLLLSGYRLLYPLGWLVNTMAALREPMCLSCYPVIGSCCPAGVAGQTLWPPFVSRCVGRPGRLESSRGLIEPGDGPPAHRRHKEDLAVTRTMTWVGLDVHARSTQAIALDALSGELKRRGRHPNVATVAAARGWSASSGRPRRSNSRQRPTARAAAPAPGPRRHAR